MKKLSIIRFKPKPGCLEAFVSAVKEHSRESATASPPTHFTMQANGEIYAVIIRDADALQESSQTGVNWLDSQRHLLEEFNAIDRHTIPLTGDLIEY